MTDVDPPQRTLHGDELSWLHLMLDGALPARYETPRPGWYGPTLALPGHGTGPGARVDLLDPEGVTLATVVVESVVDGWVSGLVEARSGFTLVDHLALRTRPVEVSPSAGPVWALWAPAPVPLEVRQAARRQAADAGALILEVVPVPTGRETSRVANAPVRLALAATTRRPKDRLLVVPSPDLPWDAPGLRLRAKVAAAYGADELLVLPGAALPADTEIPLRQVDVPAEHRAIEAERLDAWVLDGAPLPEWAAEAPVAAALRQVHRPASQAGLTVLLSGLSGSGKSTVARGLAVRLVEHENRSVSLLDGDVVRHHLSKGLGFSRPDRITNVLRIGFVASEITKAGGIAVCCPIAPYDQTRREVRAMVEEHGTFVLVHVATPLAECERRDRKGLYAKARRGEIPEFTGISDPYEEPSDAEVVIDTTGRTIESCVDEVHDALVRLGAVPSK